MVTPLFTRPAQPEPAATPLQRDGASAIEPLYSAVRHDYDADVVRAALSVLPTAVADDEVAVD